MPIIQSKVRRDDGNKTNQIRKLRHLLRSNRHLQRERERERERDLNSENPAFCSKSSPPYVPRVLYFLVSLSLSLSLDGFTVQIYISGIAEIRRVKNPELTIHNKKVSKIALLLNTNGEGIFLKDENEFFINFDKVIVARLEPIFEVSNE